MKKTLMYLSAFLLAALVFVITTAPSALLKFYVPKHININSFEGEILQGNMQQLNFSPTSFGQFLPAFKHNIYLDKLGWELYLAKLLLLKLAGQIQLTLGQSTLSTDWNYSLSNVIELNELRANLTLKDLLLKLHQDFPIAGKVLVNMDEVIINQKKLIALSGKVKALNFTVFGQNLGQVSIAVKLDDKKEKIIANLFNENTTSNVNINGFASLDLNGKYQTNISLIPKINAPKDLVDMLSLVGHQSGKGRLLKISGRI